MLATNPVTANLIKARELIADEKNWCQGKIFIGEQMCAVGALRVARGERDLALGSAPDFREFVLLERASIMEFRQQVATANDTLGHAAVMRMFDRAIELSLVPA